MTKRTSALVKRGFTETGVPLEVRRKGKRFIITPVQERRKLDKLEPHPEFIVGNPDDLVHMDWSSEWEPDS